MFHHSSSTAPFFSVLIAALVFLLSLAGVAAAQFNTSLGAGALQSNTTGSLNTAIGFVALGSNTTGSVNTASGVDALFSNTTGNDNTAEGVEALFSNTTGNFNTAYGASALRSNTTGSNNTGSGASALVNNTIGGANTANGVNALVNNTLGGANTASGVEALRDNTTGSFNTANGLNALSANTSGDFNTAIGVFANVSAANLTNATAIGNSAIVNASDKIRLGNSAVTVIEGQVAFTASSDKTKKENFKPVDGEEVLGKIRGFELSSWNFIGHDPRKFRHYGPMAQDFFAAFGHDGVGQIGTETTINSGDMAGILMIAVQALEKRTAELKHTQARLAAMAERLEALELRTNRSIQVTAEKSLGDKMVDVTP
jgi:trimeric autotransporter adhesin